MATVVNRSQQVTAAGLNPVSAYSRILTAHCAAAGGGGWECGYSQVFGQQAMLLGIDVVVQLIPGGAVEVSGFELCVGAGEPATRLEMDPWARLIYFPPDPTVQGMLVRGAFRQFHWKLARRFEKDLRRLGVIFYNGSINAGVVYVFFEISEG